MSLNFHFKKDFIGRYETKDLDGKIVKCNLYTCNGLFLATHQTKNSCNLITFAFDEQHLKSCVKDGIYKDERFIFNSNISSWQLKQVYKMIKILSKVARIEIRPIHKPIKKYYYKEG